MQQNSFYLFNEDVIYRNALIPWYFSFRTFTTKYERLKQFHHFLLAASAAAEVNVMGVFL